MRIGRNAPCPCGSGKKYKHCCLVAANDPVNDQNNQGPAQSLADQIAQAAADQPFHSLEEVNAYAAKLMNEQNRRTMTDFCGLSPEQMNQVLYNPFDCPAIQFSTDFTPPFDVRIMKLFRGLVEAIGNDGLKPTAKGNLPLKVCKMLAAEIAEDGDENDRWVRRNLTIRSEVEFEELNCTRLVSELAGLVRKTRGKFVLTGKCKKLLEKQDSGRLYFELFHTYTTKFNWAYRDGYPEADIVQRSFLFTLYLLISFGDKERPQSFYQEKFITAFPMAFDCFPDTSYSNSEDETRRVYFYRAIESFATFFGLAELTVESKELYKTKYLVSPTALLGRFLSFNY